MSPRVFLSHNQNDKPLVEPIAIKLANIFGRDKVFYDSWSIRPGDGIIDKMNLGLQEPEYVFFFVSKTSLASEMVKLEWQNALYSATKGRTRFIPVRVDGSEMPAILRQTLYIDMYTCGLETAIDQIVNVVLGGASFTPEHKGFSNLSFSRVHLHNGSIEITVSASHMVEPNPNFAFPVINEEEDIRWWIKEHPGINSAFRVGAFQLNNGVAANAVIIRPMFSTLMPRHPLVFEFHKRRDIPVNLVGVLHDLGDDQWEIVPEKLQ